jgi:hypothetical protein
MSLIYEKTITAGVETARTLFTGDLIFNEHTGQIISTASGSGGGFSKIGFWNASTNTPTLSDGSGTENGEYYVVSVAGTTSLDGEDDWSPLDWVVFNGTTWEKIDNSETPTTSLPISSLTAATATNSINNLNLAQTWNWNTSTTETGLTLTGNALQSGEILTLSTSSTALTNGNCFRMVSTGAATGASGNLVSVVNTSATSTVGLFRVTTNSTTPGHSSGSFVHFDYTGNHTLRGFQIDDVTTAGTVMKINADSLVGGVGFNVSSTNASRTGNLVQLDSSATAGVILQVNTPAAMSGSGVVIAGTTNTGKLLSVTSTTGGAYTDGCVKFTFSGSHTGTGFVISDGHATGTAMSITTSNANAGNGLAISGGSTQTGNLLSVTSTSAGAFTSGGVRFNFSGAHTGNAVQIDSSATTLGTLLDMNATALTSGTVLDASAGTALTGKLINLTMSSISGQAIQITNTGFYSNTNGMIGITDTGATSGRLFYATTSSMSTGQVMRLENTSTLFSGSVLRLASDVANTGNVLNITNSGSGTTATIVNAGTATVLNLSTTSTGTVLNLSTTSTGAVMLAAGSAGIILSPYGVAAGNTTPLRFRGLLAGSGTNSVGFKAPDTITSTVTWTLPNADGTTGQVLSTNGSGLLSWATVAAGSSSLSGLTAATATNTIDNLNFTQTWNWSTADTESLLNINANALTSGDVLSISTSSAISTSSSALLSLVSSNAAALGQLINVSSVSTGTVANGIVRFGLSGDHAGIGVYISSNSTAGTPLRIDANAQLTGNAVLINANSLTTGTAFAVASNSADTSTRNLATFTNSSSLATGSAPLKLSQSSTAPIIRVTKPNASVANLFEISDGTDTLNLAIAVQTASNTITIPDRTGTITLDTISINAQTGTTYTLVLTDAGKYVTLSNAAAIALTIPTNASVAFPIGTSIAFEQAGAGVVTVSGAGVTINSNDSLLSSNGQYANFAIIKTGTNIWTLSGNLV